MRSGCWRGGSWPLEWNQTPVAMGSGDSCPVAAEPFKRELAGGDDQRSGLLTFVPTGFPRRRWQAAHRSAASGCSTSRNVGNPVLRPSLPASCDRIPLRVCGLDDELVPKSGTHGVPRVKESGVRPLRITSSARAERPAGRIGRTLAQRVVGEIVEIWCGVQKRQCQDLCRASLGWGSPAAGPNARQRVSSTPSMRLSAKCR